MLALATKVLNDYSKVLASIDPSKLGFAESFLPHSRVAIREATKSALHHLGGGQPALREALIRGYVYLEQFVSDDLAEVLLQSAQFGEACPQETHEQAQTILADIKRRMDAALIEIRPFGAETSAGDSLGLYAGSI